MNWLIITTAAALGGWLVIRTAIRRWQNHLIHVYMRREAWRRTREARRNRRRWW